MELSVAIVAEHALVGQSVKAALAARGYVPVVARPRTHTPQVRCDVGILLTHSSHGESLATRVFSEPAPVPWLVLSAEERGPAWGALYAAGAALVAPPSVSLVEVCGLLDDLAYGRKPPGPRGRRELIRAWNRTRDEHDELRRRLTSLTVRERQVLGELHNGSGVRFIAQGSAVTEATVRSQVKAILRKLEVSSQIAAVAAYTQVQSDPAGRGRSFVVSSTSMSPPADPPR